MFGIICLGDSITYGRGEVPTIGWTGRLKQHFESEMFKEVYNLGIPGDNSIKLRRRVEVELHSRCQYYRDDNKYLILISIGVNDTQGLNTNNNLRVPEDKFRENLIEIVRTAKKNSEDIVLLTQTPVNESLTMPIEGVKYYSNEKIGRYNEIIKNVANDEECLLCDVGREFKKQEYTSILSDGIHPNSKGYQFMFEIIKNFLEKEGLI